MQNLVRKAYVFASVLVAGTSLVSVAAHAGTRKVDHHHHVAASTRHVTKRTASTHHTTSHSAHHQTAAAATRHGAAHKERVSYVIHRHGRTYTRTVWRTRTHDALLSNGVYHGYLECVPYARRVSGIDLKGDAYTWWNEAPGLYQRGQAPSPGAVLNFRANGRMPLGHVAVVQEVVNSREVLITQANWGGPGFVRGGVSSDISVVDVSPRNDWTAVRVALGHSATYGSVYPTYGFIYSHGTPISRWPRRAPPRRSRSTTARPPICAARPSAAAPMSSRRPSSSPPPPLSTVPRSRAARPTANSADRGGFSEADAASGLTVISRSATIAFP